MRDGNSFPFVCVCVLQVILAYESTVLCKCSGNVLLDNIFWTIIVPIFKNIGKFF